jgi:CRP/FNR family transcriptional regulator
MAMLVHQTSVVYAAPLRELSFDIAVSPADTCRVCDSRGGCLAVQLTAEIAHGELARNSNRVLVQGEHLFRQRDEPIDLYVVRSGSIKSYLITDDGEEQVLGFFLPGDVLGLDAMGTDSCTSSAVALETTSICRLPIARLSDRGLTKKFAVLYSEQMARGQNLTLMLARKNADGRMASLLWDISQRFERHGFSPNTFNLSMSRHDIGNYLGMAVETVSRTLSRFQDSGLLEVDRRKIVITDLGKLQSIAGTLVM